MPNEVAEIHGTKGGQQHDTFFHATKASPSLRHRLKQHTPDKHPRCAIWDGSRHGRDLRLGLRQPGDVSHRH